MTGSTVLVSTWSDGLFVIEGGKVRQELAGRGVRGLAAGDDGSVLAIVDTGKLCRRGRDGAWAQLAECQSPLSCCLISRGKVFVGTDDGAHLMRLDRDGALRRMEGFDATPGRDKWFAGAMLVDDKMMGPPLGIRSMSASPDGGVLLANVHVGGIPRSTDRGVTWHPTIDIEADVHQVVFHASRPESVAAAAAAGLCISRDGGASWRIETDGLHASHCSAVAFVGDDVFVSASESPFSKEGAVYRRPAGGAGPLTPVGGGLPRWTAGKVDTTGIGVHGQSAAIVDSAGTSICRETTVAAGRARPKGLPVRAASSSSRRTRASNLADRKAPNVLRGMGLSQLSKNEIRGATAPVVFGCQWHRHLPQIAPIVPVLRHPRPAARMSDNDSIPGGLRVVSYVLDTWDVTLEIVEPSRAVPQLAYRRRIARRGNRADPHSSHDQSI